MSLRRSLSTNRNAEADAADHLQSSLENDRLPTYTSNVITAQTHTLPGRDFVSLSPPESSLTRTLGAAETFAITTPNYIYYRIYAEDGAIPLKTPAAPNDSFLGRIKARSVPPPHTVRAVKHSIAKVEDIKDPTSTSLFLTQYSQSSMSDADKIAILNRTGPGSTPQEPLALVAKMSDSDRSALESGERGGLAGAAEPDTGIRYLYYLLYSKDYEMPSKVSFYSNEPCLGRIQADSVPPPHTLASIKRCISRVERNSALAYANLFADISCDTPLKEGHISFLGTDGQGLSPNEPMAIVQVEEPSIPLADGRYFIKNRAADIFWNGWDLNVDLNSRVGFGTVTLKHVKNTSFNFTQFQWDITHDTNNNIFMISPHAPSSWVGADMIGSTVPVPWRLIPADGKFYYLTTDIYCVSQNPLVPAALQKESTYNPGSMAILKEGDHWQMWEFIPL